MSPVKKDAPISDDEAEESFSDEYDDELSTEDELDDYDSHKRRKPAHGGFIQDEAEVDDDEEEDEEYEEGYEEVLREQKLKDSNDLYARRKANRFTNLDDEDQFQQLLDKFNTKKNRDIEFTQPLTVSERQKLLPGVNDPYLWLIKCQIGEERKISFLIMRKALKCAANNNPLPIKSVIQLDRLKGFVYVEAYKANHLKQSLDDINALRYGLNSPKIVPVEEMPDVLRIFKYSNGVKVNGWVRFKRGLYKDDLAQVVNYDPIKNIVNLRLVPRLDYRKMNLNLNERKRRIRFRPVPALFDEDKAKNAGLDVLTEGTFTTCKSMKFKNGFVFKRCHISNIMSDNVVPTIKELEMFNVTLDDPYMDAVVTNKIQSRLCVGDVVRVSEGELKDLVGVVTSINSTIVTIKPKHEDMQDNVQLGEHEIVKHFAQGDHVRVMNGEFKDSSGIIVRVDQNKVIISSDIELKEMHVLSQDLQLCGDKALTIQDSSEFTIQDFVQIDPQTVGVVILIEKDYVTVLDQFDKVQRVKPQSLRKRKMYTNTFHDQFDNSIGYNDAIRVVHGPRQGLCGRFKFFYKSFGFICSNQITDNANFCVVPLKYIISQSSKESTQSLKDFKSSFGRRRPQFAGKTSNENSLIGSSVRITKGAYKGHIGTIKHVTDAVLKVELYSRNKTIIVDRENVSVYDPSMKNTSKISTSNKPSSSDRNFAGSRTPGPDVTKTPRYGSMTPAQEGSFTPVNRGGIWDATGTKSDWNDPYDNMLNNDVNSSLLFNDSTDDFSIDKSLNSPILSDISGVSPASLNSQMMPGSDPLHSEAFSFDFNLSSAACIDNSEFPFYEKGIEVVISDDYPLKHICNFHAAILSYDGSNSLNVVTLNKSHQKDDNSQVISIEPKHITFAKPRLGSKVKVAYLDKFLDGTLLEIDLEDGVVELDPQSKLIYQSHQDVSIFSTNNIFSFIPFE